MIQKYDWLVLIIGMPIGILWGSLAGMLVRELLYGEALQSASWRQQDQKRKR